MLITTILLYVPKGSGEGPDPEFNPLVAPLISLSQATQQYQALEQKRNVITCHQFSIIVCQLPRPSKLYYSCLQFFWR